MGAKIKNLSTCNAVDRSGNYFWGNSRLVDTLVRGSIEAEGVSPLLLENTRVKGDIFSNQTGKKIVLSKSSVLHQDLLATSKGNTELLIKDRSLVLGNIVCGNFYEKCDNPSVLIKDRSKIMGMVIMGSDSGKVLIDGGIVKDIKFETLMTRSRYQNPVVEIKNNGIVERDIFFRNNRGKVIIEEGSKVKGYIMNADIVNVDKTGKVIKR